MASRASLLPADSAPLLDAVERGEAGPPLAPFEALRPQFEELCAAYKGKLVVRVVMKHNTPQDLALLASYERWAISSRCRGIVHIELLFENSVTGERIAFTVDRHDPKRPGSGRVRTLCPDPRRSYNPARWSTFMIATLSGAECHGLLAFCGRQVGKPFNFNMYYTFLPWVGPLFVSGEQRTEYPTYYCSELVAAALKWVRPRGYAHIDARRCTPAILYDTLVAGDHLFFDGPLQPADTLVL